MCAGPHYCKRDAKSSGFSALANGYRTASLLWLQSGRARHPVACVPNMIRKIFLMTTTPEVALIGSENRMPRIRFRRRPLDEMGVATVEFGFILPMLILIVSGIIEFGLALYDKAVITNASREGARAGIVLRVPAVTPAEITARVKSYTGSALLGLGAPDTVTVDFPAQSNPAYLAVRVSYTFRGLALGTLLSAINVPLVLTSTTVMVRE